MQPAAAAAAAADLQHTGSAAIELLPPSMRVPGFHDHKEGATDMIGLQPHEQQNGQ